MAHLYCHLVLLHALVDHQRNHLIPTSVVTPTLHDMSPYESLNAHVHEVEPMVVSDDDSTDDLNHDDDDASYELDPFNIDTPVDNIQAVASKFNILSRYE